MKVCDTFVSITNETLYAQSIITKNDCCPIGVIKRFVSCLKQPMLVFVNWDHFPVLTLLGPRGHGNQRPLLIWQNVVSDLLPRFSAKVAIMIDNGVNYTHNEYVHRKTDLEGFNF